MILVVGASGHLGGDICRRLVSRRRLLRGLVRPSSAREAVSRLQALGVQLLEGDLRDRASLDRACRDVAVVISTATITRSRQPGESIETTDHQGQLALVQAARAAGVGSFIYVSYSGQIGVDDPLTTAKRAVEHQLRQSGLTYTILRPSYFMEAWLSPALGFDYPNRKATIYGSGHAKISWISLGDVAEFAVQALDNPTARDAVLELGGPDALGPSEVVRIFEQVGGKPFEITYIPRAALEAQRAAAPDSLQQAFAALMLAYATGNPIPMAETLRRFPVQLTSVRQYAERVLAA